ncbi:hypothetical protein E5F05_15320 [Deinococcus metallilatus]|uniref:Uncharacterized protein n=1 Tax=Deinococcus metallilatus TaxID=1211322 RepID=A0AAJ5JZ89_9DEIO|nr:hypothetical protein [Deinococcus metallilatus]MBB5296720.1 hypothetical protein [Deinococcus metallilatus]QBY09202.1 hypothetical protein E5F05_15320 [Deinococcus metallilatus]RXJ09719.1 hypothetical protein ERJ73_14150 [Deinococcus metallilatus]TLK24185.1 hypothetical protein FCS05_15110 [Deinococcus metallilatus]GMA13751.1 hypothetical protein GCM10025871_00820 [Deinococcus metallilatus]
MNDRVLSALRGLGIGAAPLALLEREGAFFALLEGMLVYQDQNGTRRVTLRDLTRIHSDPDGLLRVETPAGTALTASLLGFDAGQVQAFFSQVRDATARAKNLPTGPLPTPGGHKTFGSVPKPVMPPAPSPGTTTTVILGASPEAGPTQEPTVQEPPGQEQKEERPAAPQAIKPGTVREVRGGQTSPAQDPVPAAPGGTKASGTNVLTKAEPKPPATPSPADSTPARVASAAAQSVVAGLEARASTVSGLVSRLQLLGVVLGLAAVGLAVFQFLGGTPLLGLWTLIAGGVGCIALLAFADVTRLLVALARAVAEAGQAADRSRDDHA